MANQDHKKDGGYSREGLFGEIIHYDADGHKVGESRPGLFGDYTDYDADGHKVGRSHEHFIGGGYDHYDADGHKTGSSQEDLFGGYTHTDNAGHVTGHSGRTVFDVKSDEEIAKTGSLYGSSAFYPHDYENPPADGEPAGNKGSLSSDGQVPKNGTQPGGTGTPQNGEDNLSPGMKLYFKIEELFLKPGLWFAILGVILLIAIITILAGKH